MATDKPILYTYFRSSCSWRVRIALAHKGIEYESRPIHLLKKEQVDDEYLRVNPMGQVPALVVDGCTILQSVAILEYLEEKYPEKPLLPSDSLEKAKVREIVEVVNSGMQPLTNLLPMQRHSDDEKERTSWLHFWCDKGFTALEQILERTSGTYCVGNEVTLADICLVSQVANAKRWNVDMSKYPKITRICDTLLQLDSFKQSHPFRQPDCPAELRI